MAISRRALFGKLNLTLFRAIESATAFAKLRGNPYVELVHWLHQLWQLSDSDLHRVCIHYRIEPAKLESDFAAALRSLPAGASSISDFSRHVTDAIERAWTLSSLEFGGRCIRGGWLLAALLQTPELRRILLGISPAFQQIPVAQLSEDVAAMVAGSAEDGQEPYDGSGLHGANPGESSDAIATPPNEKSALVRFCTDLTARACAGEIDPVIGRGHEIRVMVDILLRRRQNNPLLTGEAGVGKTAVVEGFAIAVAKGEVPPALREVRVLNLDVGALLAGASMRGEFEQRLKAVLEEAGKSAKPVVLFIDEIHTLVGAGGQAGTGDAANLLKPALARGTLRTIGATTWGEYKRHIEKDPALTRRFQVLQVMEPHEAAAVEMVRGLVSTFTRHHGVTIMDEAVIAAVTLSHRYIPARQLPDKAISLLDTACARVAMSLHAPPAGVEYARQRLAALEVERELLQSESAIGKDRNAQIEALKQRTDEVATRLHEGETRWQEELDLVQRIHALRERISPAEAGTGDAAGAAVELKGMESRLRHHQGDQALIHPEVDNAVVASVVSDWTGIPVGRMVRDEIGTLLALQAQLERRVMGQPTALNTIVQRVRAARARLTDPGKPVGAFLLVGPSGVGKTETALALAEALYGGEQNLITINMSEYQEAHTVSSLKGAPPGYVGYGEGGVLTEAVRRRPYSVVLLDEVEKAHPDVHEVFYQVFDKGWMEDGEGRVIDFKNTLILLTSNTGSELTTQLCDDPERPIDPQALREALQPELRQVFPAAFLGRLAIVPYLPLAVHVLSDIVRLQLSRVARRLQDQHGIALAFDDAVVTHIVGRCGTHESGARLLSAFIEQHMLPQLARIWLEGEQDHTAIQRIEVQVASPDARGDPDFGGLHYRTAAAGC